MHVRELSVLPQGLGSVDRLFRYPHSHPGPGRSAGNALVIRPLGGEAQYIFETHDTRMHPWHRF